MSPRAVIATLAAWVIAGSVASDESLGRVRSFGALREVMHEGQVGPAVGLGQLLPNDKLYAVGALSQLRGEITVVGGLLYAAYPQGKDSVRLDILDDSDEEACLLVTAEVRHWVSVTTESEITFDQLDAHIARLAAGAGVDVAKSFPFIIEGPIRELRWHIIDGSRLSPGVSSHEAHSKAVVKRSALEGDAVLVGFYSEQHHGVFTHMGSNTHIHCVVEKPLSSGHVEYVVLPKGLTIKFPKENDRTDVKDRDD